MAGEIYSCIGVFVIERLHVMKIKLHHVELKDQQGGPKG